MPLPTYVTIGTKTVGTTGAVTPPLATGIAVGDIDVLIATTIAGGGIAITNDGGGAWTPVPNTPVDVTAGEKLYVWYRYHQTGDTAPTVQADTDHICSACTGFHLVDQSTPIEAVDYGSETTSDISFSFATSVSTTVNNCLCVVIYTSGQDSNTGQGGTTTNTSLATLTLRAEYQTAQGLGGGFVLSTGTKIIAGAVGTWADAAMVNATPKAYVTFAVRPVLVADEAIISGVTTPSGAEDYTPAPIEYTDLATISCLASVLSDELNTTIEVATIVGITEITTDDVAETIESATIGNQTSLSTSDVIDTIEAATLSSTTEPSSTELLGFSDSATCGGFTSIETVEDYTSGNPPQHAYPIADVAITGWSASVGTDLWACLDDVDNSDYIYATAT